MPKKPEQNPDLLKEIRENYDYYRQEWAEIHKEGNRDRQFVAGDPWDPADIRSREKDEQKRPHLNFNEISQYINLFCGNARQMKRTAKIEPDDEAANAEDAEVLQGRLYHIDYVSRSQINSIRALRDAAIGGYGWMGTTLRYSNKKGREQEPCSRPIPNPDAVLMDPDCKEADCSDARGCFYLDKMGKAEFKTRFRDARDLRENEQTVQVCEYWRVTTETTDRVLWVDDGSEFGIELIESNLPEDTQVSDDSLTMGGRKMPIQDSRDIETRTLTKYVFQMPGISAVANDSDIEILESEEWPGTYIPFTPVFGEEYFIGSSDVSLGGSSSGAKRVLVGLVRNARDPMGLLNLTRTNMAERMAMMPKTRWKAVEGQLEGHEDEWNNVGTNPLGVLYYKDRVDGSPDTNLAAPQEVQWEPQLQEPELLARACMDAIRTAVGQIASPEMDKQKSGVAIQKTRETGESAAYYLTDNYNRALEQDARIKLELIQATHDTPRSIAVRSDAGEQSLTKIHQAYQNDKGERLHHKINQGGYNVTISTGPSYQSQYDAAGDFINALITSVPQLMMDGQGHTTLGDLFAKLKNLGPLGNEVAKRFEKLLRPELKEGNTQDPQAVAMKQQAQQVIDQLTAKVNELQQERDAKVVDNEYKLKLAEMNNKTTLVAEEIKAQVKENTEQLQHAMDQISQNVEHQFQIIQGHLERQHAADQQQSSQDAVAQQAAIAQKNQGQEQPVT